ncbi:xylose ABC transporter ATP-binding protein [Halanaerobacter jeridensis]|uniref:D-xylose transport system ATP-binding protein n=1 Tax=Halanaerobacter jeridensis TaxID=706427 RepID=A0A938XNM2_9FIRM|nr:D-xylose transport system ATP-binding protein [Halanaerobacter jeridensis]
MEYILETKDIIKDFPGVRALDHVSFQVEEGEIHSLCGENGAGKSTLIKVLSGVHPYKSYEGQVLLKGTEQKFSNINEAEEQRIAVIHQELTVFEDLNVTENIFMGNEIETNGIIDWDLMYKKAEKWINKLKLENVNPRTKVKSLGMGKQQLIEIAKALVKDAEILILDEPTDSLTDSETEILFDILNDLRDEGVTCIYITHKLDEVFELCDSVTVLRDGESVGSDKVNNLEKRDIVQMMVGREINQRFPERKTDIGETVLEVKDYSVVDPENPDQFVVKDVNFELKAGEVLGFSGLVGAGRTELVNSIFGAFPGEKSGEIYLEGNKIEITSPKDAINQGIALVSEDRKRFGLIPTMDVKENTSLAALQDFKESLSLNHNQEISKVRDYIDKLNVKTPSIREKVSKLSGGNQQKVVLSKNLMTQPEVLILDEPTRGIDVGAKYEIYKLIQELSKQGVAIIMISSELPEVIGVSDRILVLSQGEIAGEFDNSETRVSQEKIMMAATGGN